MEFGGIRLELEHVSQQQSNRLYMFILMSGIIFIAFNLRSPITSVGPLISLIQVDVGLSASAAGWLTSLPLLAFAVMSPLAPKIAHRLTIEWAMLIGVILIMIGTSIRPTSFAFLLFTGTLFIGLGIAILNVLLPSFVKDKFPYKIGLMTSIYTTSMGTTAAFASGFSYPIANGLGLGWKLTVFIWGAPAIVAFFLIIYLAMKNGKKKEIKTNMIQAETKMWKSKVAWYVAIFMGTQSLLFYVTVAWLPTILQDNGMSPTMAGWMLSISQFVGLPVGFLVPVIAEKFKSQQGVVIVLLIFCFLGYGGLIFSSSTTLLIISCILVGIMVAGSFPLALTMIGLRARNAKDAAELSGMAQTLGYLLAAVGPILIGFLYDFSGGWTVPLIAILLNSVIVLISGLLAGRNQYV